MTNDMAVIAYIGVRRQLPPARHRGTVYASTFPLAPEKEQRDG
jgi:hypothetical protein